jgi:YVTN family beta-propeller protein
MAIQSVQTWKFGASALILAAMMGAAPAHAQFVAPDATYSGRISAAATQANQPIVPGTEITVSGDGFKPGQEITLSRGGTVLNTDAYVADAEGKFSSNIQLPADAVPGTHPLLVNVANPSSAAVFELKISPDVPLSGEDKFTQTSQTLVRGLYQSAYSEANNTLFVTSAVGRPPVKESQLLKLDADTLATQAEVTPGAAPARPDGSDGGVFAVYGVDVDDANGNVWVTNTRQNTVAVYKQDDLSLVKQFDVGAVNHARDVVIDAKGGKAYVSATGTSDIMVIDTASLEITGTITPQSAVRGKDFSVGSLQLDPTSGKLYTVSLSTDEAAVIDLASESVEKVFALPGSKGAIGVGYDAGDNLLFVASQGSDNLLIVDAAEGTVLHNVAVGSSPINVEYDATSKLAYVSVRGSGTVTVVNSAGEIVANLDNGSYPNHVVSDGKGHIYAINKSFGAEDPNGDRITRIVPAS